MLTPKKIVERRQIRRSSRPLDFTPSSNPPMRELSIQICSNIPTVMSRCSVLLEPNILKIIACNLPYSWYNLVSEKLFICTGIEITIDEERAYQCIIQDTGLNINLLWILCVTLQHPIRICIGPISTILPVNFTF